MKKLFLGIAIFGILAFSITGQLITQKNNSIVKQDNMNSVSGDVNEEIRPSVPNKGSNIAVKEKTLDLYGTYDENDLIIEEVTEGNITYPKIKGLKNKDVEAKVNSDMKKRILEKVEEVVNENNNVSVEKTRFSCHSNFENVISILVYIPYEIENVDYGELVGLNYELKSGERLGFEDLFVENVDLHSIVRRAFYRVISAEEVNSNEFYDLHYDSQKNEWSATYWDWDTGNNFENQYIPKFTEYEINKNIKTFLESKEKDFYFTPAEVFVLEDSDFWYSTKVEFKDVAADVVIYDKYLTTESLYESSNIGKKNLWTCSVPNSRSQYLNYGFLEDNLFYEISINADHSFETNENPFGKPMKKLQEKAIAIANNKLEEYRSIAKSNKDEFYALRIGGLVANNSWNEICNLAENGVTTILYKADIKSKTEIMDAIIESYRYYNLPFYSSAFEVLATYSDKESVANFLENVTQNRETAMYDLRNLKEITSIKEIFKDNVNYLDAIREKLKTRIRDRKGYFVPEAEVNELINNSTFSLTAFGIDAKVPGIDYEITINFSEIDKSLLTIYDVDMYILPESDTRKLEKIEVQNLSLDELNKAYNEIFARHGHDFKNAELREYFNLLSWYEPVTNKSVGMGELNEFEQYNLNIIKEVIADKKV